MTDPTTPSPAPSPVKTSPYTQPMNMNKPANLVALLSTISVSEGTFGDGDNGYNVLAGGQLFNSYADHPRIVVDLRNKAGDVVVRTTAAGRYQILEGIYDAYKTRLGLTDFSPDAQDAIAIQLLKEVGAYAMILAGNASGAIQACSGRWASCPNVSGASAFGQPVQKLNTLILAYQRFGGTVRA